MSMSGPECLAKIFRERTAQNIYPADYYYGDTEFKAAIDLINSGLFSQGATELFRRLTGHLLHHDEFLLMQKPSRVTTESNY